MPNMEMIEYTTACRMAAVFEQQSKLMVDHLNAAIDAVHAIGEVMNKKDGCAFDFDIEYRSNRTKPEDMIRFIKLACWSAIIDHCGVRKVMSSKRQEDLDKALYSRDPKDADKLPDLSEETIISVIQGYALSADELLSESIAEEYDFFKPYSGYTKLKTNLKSVENAKLEKKIIKRLLGGRAWARERGTYAGYQVDYDYQKHLMNLDNIFHLLDGKGAISGFKGPLLDGIASSINGETEYFKWKGFSNGNLHLEFKRQDLLDKFNAICGRNRLGNKR